MILSIIIYLSGVISLPLFYWTFVIVHDVRMTLERKAKGDNNESTTKGGRTN